ncbi:DUF4404 family protein [Arenicella xantha]|uniref:Uncharacterized protein DUF4404 n=1 Tax=Arenicella xantha TaxID=644221 RepID=A0A395JKF6_9GAMM|nr:DUF4404 family protein [Arenicella xantha]RBP51266.1 uncharacterized protein DUF4404 [Arenicella xantha]
MSGKQLHDLLEQLKEQHRGSGMVDSEYQQHLDEIIGSLEKQALNPEAFDQYSDLNDRIRNLVVEIETDHPTVKTVLDSIREVLRNFRV